mmetsp:Transcript_37348/g.81764  ORF Transcript_37348/g.81764 Transcript_37348/m.81764 type:complete len:543 (+) Transcript_37348:96-1724(+)
MGLFATLAASAAGNDSDKQMPSSSSSSSSSAAHLPTAVQLHTSRRIDFVSGTIDGRRGESSGNAKRRFEVLSYQAVEVAEPTTSGGTSSGAGEGTADQVALLGNAQQQQPQQQRKLKHLRPNLGVWDCRMQEGRNGGGGGGDASNELIDRLLEQVVATASPLKAEESSASASGEERTVPTPDPLAAPPTVIFAVDLSDPAGVHPAVDAMASALVRRYDGSTANKGIKYSPAAAATTRVSKLRTSKFGAAPESTEPTSADTKGSDARISLVVCCAVPPTPVEGGDGAVPAQTFQDKQAVSLVLYHLHRFASEVDCTLVFVRADNDGSAVVPMPEDGSDQSSPNGGMAAVPSMTVSEFAGVVSRVALGMSPVEEEDKPEEDAAASESIEGDEDPAPVTNTEQPSVYAPGTHDDDLIGSVLLRNASCPGVWDAAKDDLWKALPPRVSAADAGDDKSESKKNAKVGGAAADHEWLSKLAASLPTHGTASGGDDASVKTSKSSKSSAAGGSSLPKASGKKKKPSSSKTSTESKNDDPTSFFENLMKK